MSVRRMRATPEVLRDAVRPEHRQAAEEDLARLQADRAASSGAARVADGRGPGARATQPGRAFGTRLRLAAAGGLLAAGMIVLAAAAASGGSGSGPASGAAATGAMADRALYGPSALVRARQGTDMTLASRVNPSVAGGSVIYVATVRPAPGGGTVAFTDGTAPVSGCAAQLVDNSGTATCQVAYPSPSAHAITAAYSGNAWYSASTSAAMTQQVTYRVQMLDNPAPSGTMGPAVPVRIMLLDAAGTNVSGPGITVTLTGLSPSPFPGTAPGGTFTAVNLGLWPCYQLIINTAGYPAGSYTLSFVAGSDPTTHTAQFVVP